MASAMRPLASSLMPAAPISGVHLRGRDFGTRGADLACRLYTEARALRVVGFDGQAAGLEAEAVKVEGMVLDLAWREALGCPS